MGANKMGPNYNDIPFEQKLEQLHKGLRVCILPNLPRLSWSWAERNLRIINLSRIVIIRLRNKTNARKVEKRTSFNIKREDYHTEFPPDLQNETKI